MHGITWLINATGDHMLWDANANHTTANTKYTGQCLRLKVLNRSELIRSPHTKIAWVDRHFNRNALIVLILITVITVDFVCNFNLQSSADTLFWGN